MTSAMPGVSGAEVLRDSAVPGPDRSRDRPEDDASDDFGSLQAELKAAADAASSQIALVAATASAEARLSIEAAISSAYMRSLSAAFLLLALLVLECLFAWWAVGAGASVAMTLVTAVIVNLIFAGVLHLWHERIDRKIGFRRTSQLLKEFTSGNGGDLK